MIDLKSWVLLTLVALLLTGVVLASAAPLAGYTIDWWTGDGGGGYSSGSGYSLNGTIGQPFVGGSSAGNLEICSGFWECGGMLASAPTAGNIYLPVVLKN